NGGVMRYIVALLALRVVACSDSPTNPDPTYTGPDLNGFHLYKATMKGIPESEWVYLGVMVLQHDFESGQVGGFLFWTADVPERSLYRDWMIVLGDVLSDGSNRLRLWSPNDAAWRHEATIAGNGHMTGQWEHTDS